MEKKGAKGRGFTKFMEEMEKTGKLRQYKIYEKFSAEALGHDLKNPAGIGYWKMVGEAVEYYGKAEIFENMDTLAGKVLNKRRGPALNNLLDDEDKKILLKKYPRRCPKCGFHRFFGVRMEVYSVGNMLDFFCPNCGKEFPVVGSDRW